MKVSWTPTAELSYAKELGRISEKWTAIEISNFMDLVDDFVQKLESGIIEGRLTDSKTLRSFVISKQITLFFDVFEDLQTIELLLFWNNSDNPKILKKHLR